MFLFNYFEVCRPLCKENKNAIFSPLNQQNKKCTWFSCKIFVLEWKKKVKDKNCCFRRVICRTPWSFLNQIKHAFFWHVSNVLGMCRGVRMRLHTSYAEACINTKEKKKLIVYVITYGPKSIRSHLGEFLHKL